MSEKRKPMAECEDCINGWYWHDGQYHKCYSCDAWKTNPAPVSVPVPVPGPSEPEGGQRLLRGQRVLRGPWEVAIEELGRARRELAQLRERLAGATHDGAVADERRREEVDFARHMLASYRTGQTRRLAVTVIRFDKEISALRRQLFAANAARESSPDAKEARIARLESVLREIATVAVQDAESEACPVLLERIRQMAADEISDTPGGQ